MVTALLVRPDAKGPLGGKPWPSQRLESSSDGGLAKVVGIELQSDGWRGHGSQGGVVE